ncbi:hypothetical protein VNO77_17461 [Canavalia gladiata]|uniref:Uncharacterized protein n=1 Tax=Canavalia gladiata TaxID=3824 RepID=A0AAN9LNV9_CANGL
MILTNSQLYFSYFDDLVSGNYLCLYGRSSCLKIVLLYFGKKQIIKKKESHPTPLTPSLTRHLPHFFNIPCAHHSQSPIYSYQITSYPSFLHFPRVSLTKSRFSPVVFLFLCVSTNTNTNTRGFCFPS